MKVWNRTREQPPADAIYVGRGSVWGNPYRIGDPHPHNPDKLMDRADVLKLYHRALPELLVARGEDGKALRRLEDLVGKDLVCNCAPLPCHANLLMNLANGRRLTFMTRLHGWNKRKYHEDVVG